MDLRPLDHKSQLSVGLVWFYFALRSFWGGVGGLFGLCLVLVWFFGVFFKHSFVPFPQQGEGESARPHNPKHSSSNLGAKKKFHSFHGMKIRLSIDQGPMDKVLD